MTPVSLTMMDLQRNQLQAHLFPGDGNEAVAIGQIAGCTEFKLRIFLAAQRRDEDIAFGMHQRLLVGEAASRDQVLDVGMVDTAENRLPIAKAIKATVAAVTPGYGAGLQQ